MVTMVKSGEDLIKYVAIDPRGELCNPTGNTKEELIHVLEEVHRRTGFSGKWGDIKKLGYTIHKAMVIIMERIE